MNDNNKTSFNVFSLENFSKYIKKKFIFDRFKNKILDYNLSGLKIRWVIWRIFFNIITCSNSVISLSKLKEERENYKKILLRYKDSKKNEKSQENIINPLKSHPLQSKVLYIYMLKKK